MEEELMGNAALDTNKVQAFAGRLMGILNGGLVGIMLSIGHRTGLFDRMGTLGPATSIEIARAAGLEERYVREWLASLVMGRIVDYDGRRGTYHLPPEHAACLTRAAGPHNLAILAQGIGEYGAVEGSIIECFKSGGGLPYDADHRFHDFAAEMSGVVHDATLVSRIVPAAGMTDRLSAGIDVLDVGCGKGHSLNILAKAFPKSRFVGIDLCAEAASAGRDEASSLGLTNVRFEQRDAAELDSLAAYDFVTAFDTIHDQGDPAGVLARIRAALRPGGTFLCVDIAASSNLADNVGHPIGAALYAVSTMHCTPVSLAQKGGAGLGTMWGQELALEMIGNAGFRDVSVQRVEGDLMNNYYVARG
jgi:SAM-dependent methyltransferase